MMDDVWHIWCLFWGGLAALLWGTVAVALFVRWIFGSKEAV